ncbi:MAG: tryptophan synthase alpha chain [Saprospiraceae bacterium]
MIKKLIISFKRDKNKKINLNRIRQIIETKGKNILNVYFTAGYPTLDSIVPIIKSLEDSGADIIELGMPYSDPLADGLTIQQSSEKALANGLNLKNLFESIAEARKTCSIPIIMMGYFNQLLQYGVEDFLALAQKNGVDGMIIPDLPMEIYKRDYQALFSTYRMGMSFLITPMTSDVRIQLADELSDAFIYMVSQSSITGKKGDISAHQKDYFERINNMKLQSPRLIGFGIHDNETYRTACNYSHGAIIGSAYIRALKDCKDVSSVTKEFVSSIRGN